MKEVKFCPNCGQPINDNMVYCENCGERIPRDVPGENESRLTGSEQQPESIEKNATPIVETEKENKRIKKHGLFRVSAVVAVVMVIIAVIGFGLSGNNYKIKREVSNMSEDEIQQAALDLYSQLIKYSSSDEEKFADLFIGATEDDLDHYADFFSGFHLNEESEPIVTVVIESIPSFAIEIDSFDTEWNEISDEFIMTYTEEGWKEDNSSTTFESVYSEANMKKVYPEEYMDAYVNDRNFASFDRCFSYLNDENLYSETSFVELAFMSQNEKGGIDIYVYTWQPIGENMEHVQEDDIILTVTDDSLGTVLDQVKVGCLTAGREGGYLIHTSIESDFVLTGMEKWTNLQPEISYKSHPRK